MTRAGARSHPGAGRDPGPLIGRLGDRLFPPPAARIAGAVLDALLPAYQGPAFDFSSPKGEPALLAPDSLHWRVFKNPVSLYVGGVAAVILELAEPGVAAGVWEHSRFREDPVGRMRRTGHAAMVSIYGPAGEAKAMIRRIVDRHARVSGVTSSGLAYSAADPRLLAWVQATTAFGFSGAYSRYVDPLTPDAVDRFYAEAGPASRLYGVETSPRGQAEFDALLSAAQDGLQRTPALGQFLAVMRGAPIMPPALRWMQPLFLRAAVDLIPAAVRRRLSLDTGGLRPAEAVLVRRLGALADRIPLGASPAVQACVRLGLPRDWLYRPR